MKPLITNDEIQEALKLVDAWKDPALPQRQWDVIVKERELVAAGRQDEVAPYRSFVETLRHVDYANLPEYKLLDLGAASGIYSDILKRAGYKWSYRAADYSAAFREFALTKYPHLEYDLQDATALEYQDNSFEILLHGCCLIHIRDWRKAIMEAARVSKRYVLFHRTPILDVSPTRYFLKEAYGVPCFDIWFGASEFFEAVRDAGLVFRWEETVFKTQDYGGYGQYSYLFEKK